LLTEERFFKIQSKFKALEGEIKKVIVGHEWVIRGVLICLLCGGHVLLEGVPGLGKTLLVRTLGQTLGLKFSRIQFTPDLMPADIIGTNIIMEDESGRRYFEFSRGPIFAHIILADEINRATPKTQSALLEAMQERSSTVGTTTYKLEEPFIVLATQNPIEMEGTFPLPEAQIDRFFFKVNLSYPSLSELEEIISKNTRESQYAVSQILTKEELLAAKEIVAALPVAEQLVGYASRLVYATHPQTKYSTDLVNTYVEYGSSPRGGLSLIMGAKANAFLAGEVNVRLKDIHQVFYPSLNHRIILNFRGEAEGIKVKDLLDDILKRVPEHVT
jgi:MoxR-like ATPase